MKKKKIKNLSYSRMQRNPWYSHFSIRCKSTTPINLQHVRNDVTYRSYERNRDLDSEFDLWLTVANMQLQLKDNFDDFSVITVYVKCGTIEDLEEFGMYCMPFQTCRKLGQLYVAKTNMRPCIWVTTMA
jgi:hypothetical protein